MKKIIAFLLAGCLLAGCGKVPAGTEGSKNVKTVSAAVEASSPAKAEETTGGSESSEEKANGSDTSEEAAGGAEASEEKADGAATSEDMSDSAATSEVEEAKASEETAVGEMSVGEVYHGFLLENVYSSTLLSSDLYTFTHEKSGADLIFIKNSDPECAFCISYKTPYVDETDTNHVFEHAIIASSGKYPSKNIFFDMVNKSYSTYVNAHTYLTATMYPLASRSEEQLMKMMDVYMSCMAEPGILENENIFKREAVRFEMEDPEGEISINGTVFSEDEGCLTDQGERSLDNLLDALYPGEIASNMIGKAEYHYDDLTYEHTLETYERCYHFDNSLITLYGNLDIDRFLSFLDAEYLSKYEVYGTDLSAYKDPLTEAGYVEQVMDMPAYEGDTVENNGIIQYAIDLQEADYEELVQWEILSSVLNSPSSCLGRKLIEDGIPNPVSVAVATGLTKPCLLFKMDYANEDQMQTLKGLAEYVLNEVAENGVSEDLLKAAIRGTKLSTVFLRDASNVGVGLAQVISLYWSSTGKADYYELYENVLAEVEADSGQEIFKSIAQKQKAPRRSALIANIPRPGLAEEHEAQLEAYLADMKETMSEEEKEALVRETKEFNEWNESEISNNDFQIDLANIPDYEGFRYDKTEEDGITYYLGDVDAEGAGSYKLYFDLSGMTKDEILALKAYLLVLLETKTSKYGTEELEVLESEYLYGIYADLLYPGENAGSRHRPMLVVGWKGLTEDFSQSLDLVMHVLLETDLTDTDSISYVISRDADSYDLGRADGDYIAMLHATAAGTGTLSDTYKFQLDCEGQDLYHYLSDAAGILAGDGDAAAPGDGNALAQGDGDAQAFTQAFEQAREKAFSRTNLIFASCANPEENKAIRAAAADLLSKLPEKAGSDSAYELPTVSQKTGVIVEESLNNTYMTANFREEKSFRGAYIPYIYAASDKYITPQIRFRLGAYSANSLVYPSNGEIICNTYSDPNIKKSVDVIEALPDYLGTAQLAEDDFKGYALLAYSDATAATGIWADAMRAVNRDILGVDEAACIEDINDIKNADLSMQAEAAASIGRIFENAALATAGNEAKINAEKDQFEKIINYKED